MAQQLTAQGTITIIDTTDIERIYVVYAKHNNNTDPTGLPADYNWTESIASAPGTGNYVWQRTVVKKSGSNALSYGDPVCVTGPEGADAKNITAIETQYGISANWNTQPVEADWSTDTPNYNSSKPNYWTRTRLKYEDNTYSSWIVTKDYALTKAVYDSTIANSIAQHSNENAQGAMSQAANGIKEIFRVWYRTNSTSTPAKPSAHVITSENNVDNTWTKVKPIAKEGYRYYFYCEETVTNGGVSSWTEPVLDTSNLSAYEVGLLQAKVRNYWWDSNGAHIASGLSNGTEVTKDSAPTTYGYHALTGLGGISFGYNNAKVVDLNSTGPALYFYSPPTITNNGQTAVQGNMTMGLTSTALNFYDPNEADGTNKTAKATLNANGLILKKGGIKAGTEATAGAASNNGYIYLSSEDGPRLTINNFLPGTGSSDPQWRAIIGSKFGVLSDGTLYANNAVISGTMTIGVNSTINGTSASTVVSNASTGANAASDLATYKTTVSNTYATQQSLTNGLGTKASVDTEYSVEIIPSNFNPGATSGNLVTLTAKVTRTNGGSITGLKYQWFGDGTSLGTASTTATSYNVPYNTTYNTFTVEIS